MAAWSCSAGVREGNSRFNQRAKLGAMAQVSSGVAVASEHEIGRERVDTKESGGRE
jgi:hypothetical protein